MTSSTISAGAVLQATAPKFFMNVQGFHFGQYQRAYDVTPDGNAF